jgi:arabinofuranosyltransferase
VRPSRLAPVADSAQKNEDVLPLHRRSDMPTILITLFALGIYAQHAWAYRALFLGNACDDAYISFRYLENLATGHGLVYNPGERVEGFSNLLWILLLFPFRLAGADIVRASQLLGIGFGAATITLAVISIRRLFSVHSPLGTAFVALLPATSGYFAAWSIGGLEGNLFAFLLLGAWFFYHDEAFQKRRFPWSALFLGLLAMTRPEGFFIALAGATYHVAQRGFSRETFRDPKVWRFLLVLGVILSAYEGFRVATYGPHLFPNSVRAKVGLSFAAIERGIDYVHERFASPYLVLLLPSIFVFRRDRHPALATAAVLFAASIGLVIIAGGDWSFGRLFAPSLPLGAVALVGAAAEINKSDVSWRRLPTRIAAGVVVAAYLIFAWRVTGSLGEAKFFGPFAQYDAERIRIGKWLRANAPRDAKIAVYAAGQIPYYSGLYAHDMLGLNDAHIAAIEVPSLGRGIAGHEKSDPDYTLKVVKPDIIIDAHLVPGMRDHPILATNYELLPGFRYNAVYVKTNLVDALLPTIPK